MAGTQMDGGYEEELLARWDEYADTRLGPAIAADARRYCPVDTGDLKDSIENHMGGDHRLIVSATGGAGGRTYAAYLRGTRASRRARQEWSSWTRDCPAKPVFEACAFPAPRRVTAG